MMRHSFLFSILCVVLICGTFNGYGRKRFEPSSIDAFSKDTIIRIASKRASGFNYPYYIFIPKGTIRSNKQFLLVETNNTGNNDTLGYHDVGAKLEAISQSSGSGISRMLKVPFLVPAFPRPATDSLLYTHAFDRDAALIKKGDMKRLDLQLVAMIKDARAELSKFKIGVNDKVLMNGFSASGTFANRFTFIHPEIVAATVCGGINAIAMLPVKSIDDIALDYPLGLNDFRSVFNKKMNMDAYRKVPQLLYMGENDNNDAVLYDDAYRETERQKVFTVIGKAMLTERWKKCEAVYKENGINATFKVYEKIGHGTDERIHSDIVEFFKGIMKNLNDKN